MSRAFGRLAYVVTGLISLTPGAFETTVLLHDRWVVRADFRCLEHLLAKAGDPNWLNSSLDGSSCHIEQRKLGPISTRAWRSGSRTLVWSMPEPRLRVMLLLGLPFLAAAGMCLRRRRARLSGWLLLGVVAACLTFALLNLFFPPDWQALIARAPLARREEIFNAWFWRVWGGMIAYCATLAAFLVAERGLLLRASFGGPSGSVVEPSIRA